MCGDTVAKGSCCIELPVLVVATVTVVAWGSRRSWTVHTERSGDCFAYSSHNWSLHRHSSGGCRSKHCEVYAIFLCHKRNYSLLLKVMLEGFWCWQTFNGWHTIVGCSKLKKKVKRKWVGHDVVMITKVRERENTFKENISMSTVLFHELILNQSRWNAFLLLE